MLAKLLLSQILHNEALTRGLGDEEARVLVEWLVDQTEALMRTQRREGTESAVNWLCLRGRAVARFVRLWCLENARGAAGQLAAAERFSWPLPQARVDPCELMQAIVGWEGDQFWQRRRFAAAV